MLRKKAETQQSSNEYKKAAQLYVRLFRKYPNCGKLDEVLYNAALNFEAARLIGRAIKVRRVLIEKYPESAWSQEGALSHRRQLPGARAVPQGRRVLRDVRATSTRANTARGARKPRSRPERAERQGSTQDAVFFRLGLGDDQKATDDAKLYEKNYAKKYPRETSQVNYSLASIYERQDDWDKAINHYSNFLKQFKKTALPHEVIQANVNAGRAYLNLTGARRQQEREGEGSVRRPTRPRPRRTSTPRSRSGRRARTRSARSRCPTIKRSATWRSRRSARPRRCSTQRIATSTSSKPSPSRCSRAR